MTEVKMIAAIVLLAAIPPSWFGLLIPPPNQPNVHYTDLAWQPGPGNPPETTFNVYKAPDTCAAAAGTQFVKIAANVGSGPAGLTYRDYDVVAGKSVCYYVTSFSSGTESGPSVKADATTPTDFK